MKITFLCASFVRVMVLAVGLILSGQNGFAGGYTNNFSSGIGSAVTGGSAAIVGGTILELTPKAPSTYGTLLVNDLDPGLALQSFTVTFDLYIYNGGELGGDGLSLNFGNPTNYPSGNANYELGVGSGLNFRFETYTINRTSLGTNSAGLVVSSPYTDVGNGSTDRMTISYDRISGATFNYRGQTISLTAVQLGGFVPQPGFRFLIGARCGGANESHRIDNVTITTVPQSTNANLAGIFPSVGALTPVFSGNTTNYTVNVAHAVTNIALTPAVAQSNATVKVNGVTVVSGNASGNIALNAGTNVVTVAVTAENGILTKTYTVAVIRAPSSNADLGNLVLNLGTLSPVFASGTTNYTTEVVSTITSLIVTPTVGQINATVTVNGVPVASGSASGSLALNPGFNTNIISVTAQDLIMVKTYTLIVARLSPPFIVTTATDEFDTPSGANLSLREALRDAAASHGAATILFHPSLNGATIRLTGGVPVNGDGDAAGVTIDGSTLPDGITIHGNDNGRVVDNAGNLTLRALTLTGGSLAECCGGAAVYHHGSFMLLDRCTITGNVAGYGPGIFTESGCTTTLKQCTLWGNTATVQAGAVYNRGTTIFIHCTVAGNTSQADAGGIYNRGDARLSLENSIVAGNTAASIGPDIYNFGSLTNIGVNIVQAGVDGDGPSVGSGTLLTNVNPALGALTSNGGPTQTMLPKSGSSAIDAAVGSTDTADQRGFLRPVDGDTNGTVIADIGAVEVQSPLQNTVNFIGSLSGQNYKFNRPATKSALSGQMVYFTVISFTTTGTGDVSVVVTPNGFSSRVHLYRDAVMNPFLPRSSLFQTPTNNSQIATNFGDVGTITNQLVISGTNPEDVGTFTGSLTISGGGAISLQGDYRDRMAQVVTSPAPTAQIGLPGSLITNSVYAKGVLPHTFQWYTGFRPPIGTPPDPTNIVVGATNSTYIFTATNSGGETQVYWCWMTGTHYPGGTVTNIRSSTFTLDVANTNVSVSGSIDSGDCVVQTSGCSGFPGGGYFEVHRFRIYTQGYYTFNITPGFSAMVYQGFFDPANAVLNCWGGLSGNYPPGEFELVVTGSGNYSGTITSSEALNFIPPIPPTFLQNPLPTTITPGSSATMTCSTTCGTPRSLQWYKGLSGDTNNPIPGAVNASYTTPPLTNDTYYWVRMTHAGGTIDSDTGPVYVITGPISYSGVLSDCDRVFNRPSGPGTLSGKYCYYKTFVFRAGTSGTYQFNVATNGFNSRLALYSIFLPSNPTVNLYQLGQSILVAHLFQSSQPWYLVVSSENANDVGSFTVTQANGPAIITPVPAPVISVQPVTTNIFKGQTATLSVTSSSLNVSYQWYHGLTCSSKVPISGANSNSYTTPIMTGYSNYWVELNNPGGYVFSQLATVRIIPEAFDDNVNAIEDVASTLVVVTNDIKADNRNILPIITTYPSHGNVTVEDNSTIIYQSEANYFGQDSFTYRAYDGLLQSSNATVHVTVAPVADTPSVTPATILLDQQTSSGLVVTKNSADGAEITLFKITGIQNGTLYQNNGTTVITNGEFITLSQGDAGLKFTPTSGLFSPFHIFGFTAQAALSASSNGISPGITALIRVDATPVVVSAQATHVNILRATLNGIVMPRDTNAAVFFQYGSTTNYSSSTPPQNFTAFTPGETIGFTNEIGGLARGTTYHFRAVASNATAVVYGPDQTFTTLLVDSTVPQMTTLNHFRLGDIDTGAANGNIVNLSLDSVGTNHLTASNSPVYINSVPSIVADTTGSQLAVSLNGTNKYLRGNGLSTITNRFCLEAWVKPQIDAGIRVIAYNGTPNQNGWGFLQMDTVVAGWFGGVTFVPLSPQAPTLPVGVWTHIALVENDGLATLYTNGVPAGPSISAYPRLPDSAGFGVGTDPNLASPYGAKFLGFIDEVRLSSFLPGQFNTNAFLVNGLPPDITTLPASPVTAISAVLNATAFPAGFSANVYFEYGITTNYGSFSATNTLSANLNARLPVAIALNGLLSSDTLIHYRAVLDFSALGKTSGQDALLYLLRIRNVSALSTNLLINAVGVPGRAYRLQSTTNLAPPIVWQNIGSPKSAGSSGDMQFTNAITGSSQFFRISE